MTRQLLLFAAFLLGLPAAAALAQSDATPPAQPELLEALLRCRTIADPAAKLQCFEAATAALEQAVERREVVVVDREQVREGRRRLFGLSLPSLPIFGGGGDDDVEEEDEVTSLEGVVASVSWTGLGRLVIRLEDGGVWHQVDDRHLGVEPRAGHMVVINRGALGSYMMRINRQPGIRVQRRL